MVPVVYLVPRVWGVVCDAVLSVVCPAVDIQPFPARQRVGRYVERAFLRRVSECHVWCHSMVIEEETLHLCSPLISSPIRPSLNDAYDAALPLGRVLCRRYRYDLYAVDILRVYCRQIPLEALAVHVHLLVVHIDLGSRYAVDVYLAAVRHPHSWHLVHEALGRVGCRRSAVLYVYLVSVSLEHYSRPSRCDDDIL